MEGEVKVASDNNIVLKYEGYTKDEKGLHIKYSAADTKFNRENWGLVFTKIQDGLNQPFVLTSGKVSYGPYGIYHPVLWGLSPYGAYPDINTERAYSWNHAIGYCSDISTTSEIAVASMQEGDTGPFIYPTMTVTDQKAIDEFLDDDSLIPRSISIGIIGYHKNEDGLYDDYNIFHWAAVPDGLGAYGHKARQIAACMGTKKECLPQLKVASLTPVVKDYCVATALNDLKSHSSLNSEKENHADIKVAGDKTNPQGEDKPNNAPVKIMQIKPEYIGKAVIPETKDTEAKPQSNNNNNDSAVLSKLELLEKEMADLKKGNALKDREMELRKITPQFLFKTRDEYEKAIKENLESNKTIEHITDVYKVQLEAFALKQGNSPAQPQPTYQGEVAGGVPDAVGGAGQTPEVKTASSEEAIKRNRAINETYDLLAGSFMGGSY